MGKRKTYTHTHICKYIYPKPYRISDCIARITHNWRGPHYKLNYLFTCMKCVYTFVFVRGVFVYTAYPAESWDTYVTLIL